LRGLPDFPYKRLLVHELHQRQLNTKRQRVPAQQLNTKCKSVTKCKLDTKQQC
jgi:hypothetical protein